jgi:hypothetical protein
MSYQPRRVADIVDDPAAPDIEPAVELNPRRAATSLVDKLFHRGGGVAAAVTVAATAAAVLIGATGGAASAVGVPVAAAAPVASQQLIADELVLLKPATLTATSSHPNAMAVSRQFSEGSLNVRAEASKDSKLLGRIAAATQVAAISEVEGDYRKIVFKDGFGWVLNDELSDSAEAAVPEGTSMEPCFRGSQVENKLRKTTIFIYRSVCPLFPELNSVGGWRAGGMQFHKNGRALDLMLTPGEESALGWRITKYLIAHKTEFKIDHIIFEQKIWTPSSGRWKKMADRGSVTANHFNHVHVAVTASAP